jgi:hypothetical protein
VGNLIELSLPSHLLEEHAHCSHSFQELTVTCGQVASQSLEFPDIPFSPQHTRVCGGLSGRCVHVGMCVRVLTYLSQCGDQMTGELNITAATSTTAAAGTTAAGELLLKPTAAARAVTVAVLATARHARLSLLLTLP